MQIVVPFEPSQNDDPASFMLPQLDRGESISAMVVSEDNLALGTSLCRVLQYNMAGYSRRTRKTSIGSPSAKEFVPSSGSHVGSTSRLPNAATSVMTSETEKQPLDVPPFAPPLPPLSLEPSLLQSENPNVRNGMNDKLKSIFTAYTLLGEPAVSALTLPPNSSFGPISDDVLISPGRRKVSTDLIAKADTTDGDYLMTIPSKALDIDLMENYSNRKSNRPRHKLATETLPNPNKTLYSKKLSALCYKEGFVGAHKSSDSAKVSQLSFLPLSHQFLQDFIHFLIGRTIAG
jgi:hypothetical protein